MFFDDENNELLNEIFEPPNFGLIEPEEPDRENYEDMVEGNARYKEDVATYHNSMRTYEGKIGRRRKE